MKRTYWILSVALLFLFGLVYLFYVQYSKNKYVDEYFINVFGNKEKVVEVCIDRYVPKEITTLDNVIAVHELCDCAANNILSVLKEKDVYKAIKKDIVNVFNITFARELLVDIAFARCADETDK